MDYDISQSFPSRSVGTQDAENRRIERIAHELRRCCGIHEAQFGTGKDSLSLSDAEAQGPVIGETEMLMAAQKAEEEFKAGQCTDMQSFEKRFQKWL